MKAATIVFLMVLSWASISQIQAISCNTCNGNCLTDPTPVNKTCLTGQDACIKVDFVTYVWKACVTYSLTCPGPAEFKSTQSNIYGNIGTQIGSTVVDAQLVTNLNTRGNRVMTCCRDKDYCNSGARKSLGLVAVFGMVFLYTALA